MTDIIANTIASTIGQTIEAVSNAVNKKDELIAQSDTQQTQIDNTEASNTNLFISGWRPACGWCCTLALAYHAILQPFILFIFAIFGRVIQLPQFDTQTLTTTLWGLLGLGAFRTIEKIKK